MFGRCMKELCFKFISKPYGFVMRLNQVSNGMVVCVRICGGIKFCVKCGGRGEVSHILGNVFDGTEA
jgi:hypothetical protein